MKRYILKSLFLILIFTFIFGLNVSAATGEITEEEQFLYYAETKELYDFTYSAINKAITEYKTKVAVVDDSSLYYVVKIHTGNYNASEMNIWVYISDSPYFVYQVISSNIYIQSSDGNVYQQRYKTSSNGLSINSATNMVAVDSKQHSYFLTDFVCSSHDLYDADGNLYCDGILETSFDGPGFSYDSMVDFTDNSQAVQDANQSVLDEILVTEEEEPNVFLRVFKNISNIMSYVYFQLFNLSEKVFEFIDTFLTNISTIISDVLKPLTSILTEIKEFVLGIMDKLKNMFISLASFLWTYELIEGISLNSMWEFFHDIIVEIRDFLSQIIENGISFPDLLEIILPDNLLRIIAQIYDFGLYEDKWNFITFLENVIIFLFVPDDEYLENKIDAVVLEKFGFIEAGYAFMDSIKSVLNQTQTFAPVITTNTVIWNDITIPSFTISFEWYEKFKPYVDPIVSSFVWLWFAWHVITNFPNIIHGRAILSGVNSLGSHMTEISDKNKIETYYGWK